MMNARGDISMAKTASQTVPVVWFKLSPKGFLSEMSCTALFIRCSDET
jgi:hypothetical protein